MTKVLRSSYLLFLLLPLLGNSQPCQISQVIATPLPCNDYSFLVNVDLEVNNASSPGFTLVGNGVIYGTYLYSDLPVTVGPLYGDNESTYSFIVWDVENPECQNFTTLLAADCGPLCSFSNLSLNFLQCVNSTIASVEVDFDSHNPMSPTFDLYYSNGQLITTQLYASLPYLIQNFIVNGAAPITLTVCDHNNQACCQTFVVDAIDCNPTNCEIYNISVDPECLTSNFVVHLDFETDNPPSDSFTVQGNSLFYGVFGYNQLPIVLGPLNGNTNLNWEFNIRDRISATCTGKGVLGVYNCPPPCSVLSLSVEPELCNGNEAFALQVEMDIEGRGHNGFSLFSGSTYYGTFQYNDLPITIPDFEVGDFIDQVTVCDNENSGCCATVLFESLLCNGCLIYNLEATPLPCNDQDEIFVSIDFDFQNVSGSGFSISGNGEDFGNYVYEDVPVLVGPFPGDGSQFLEFVVTDLENNFCFDATEIGILPCDSICELTGLVVETGACTGNNQYILHLNFNHSGMLGNGFDLTINGEYYDSYSYTDLPLTLLEFPSNGDGPDTISVCDNVLHGCCTTLEFESPDCACSIFETTAQTLGCTSDSTFAISVEFYSQNFFSNVLDVSLDGIFLGTYNIDNIPFVIENIPEGDGSALLTICGHDEGNCCDNTVIELTTCDGPQCLITDLLAEVGDCNSDTTYLLDITFNHLNLPTDSVDIWGNNVYLGSYIVNPDFIRLENFPVFGDSTTTIIVCAVGTDACCGSYSFETPQCIPVCAIWDLVAAPGDCLSDSTYVLVLEYNSEDVPGDSVTVSANGNFLGTFISPTHHISIEPFPVLDSSLTLLSVCSAAFPDCCSFYEFETVSCACVIDINFIEHGPCQDDSTFSLAVDFLFQQLPTDSVTLTANDTLLGTFHVQEGHILMEHFPVLASDQTVITICAVGAPDCCGTYEFETPECGECMITDLVAEPGECTSDSTFILDIVFQWHNLPADSVLIYGNGHFIGTFHPNPDLLRIENFPTFDSENMLIEICALGAPDCCATYSFTTPPCGVGDECNIFDISVQPFDCSSDSTFGILINFQYEHISSGGFDIYTGDGYLGFFSLDQIPLETGLFPANESGEYVVIICEAGNLDCCTSYEFEGPVCVEGGCDINDLEWSVTPCDSAGNFYFILNFNFQNEGDEGFSVIGNGNNYGSFNYNDLPVEIGPFETNNVSYEFLVQDNQEIGCIDFVEPGDVDCIVATIDIDHEPFFSILNNGSLPGIHVKQDLKISLFNSNGKMITHNELITTGTLFELNGLPVGVYIANVICQGNSWPVKLVKGS